MNSSTSFILRVTLAIVLTKLLLPSAVSAQPIVQEFEFDGDLSSEFVELSIAPFDTNNDTRQLVDITLEMEATVDMEILITNFTSLDLEPGDWFYDGGANLILAFDSKPGFADGGPFFGLGGVFQNGITGELSAGSGGFPPPFGNPTPGDVTVTADLNNNFESTVQSSSGLSYFLDDQPLTAKLAPFQDFVLSPPEGDPGGFIQASAQLLEYSGFLTVTYNWVEGLGRPEDCNGDGQVDFDDLSCVCALTVDVGDVLNELNLIEGDLDGDGAVAFADFLILSERFGGEGNYLDGDFDCDGQISFADFLVLSANFGLTTEEVFSVPEPRSVEYGMLAFILLVILQAQRTNSK